MNRILLQSAWPLSIAFLLLIGPTLQAADIITLKSTGKVVSGEIATISPENVLIKAGLRKDMPTNVPVNDIARIEWDGEPKTLNAARNAEQVGRYEDASKSYAKFLADSSVVNAKLRTDLEYFIARCAAKQAVTDPSKVADATAKLEAFQRKHPKTYHHYEILGLIGDLQLAGKSYPEAITTFRELAKAKWKDVQLAARCSEARVLVAQKKPAEALAIYSAVLNDVGNDPKLKPLKNQASLGKAAGLQATDKHAEALKVLQDVIDAASIGETSLLAETYLLQGDSYRHLTKNKDALMAYLHVDVLFAKEVKFHPQALYYLSQLWAGLGKADRSADAKSRLQTNYPKSEWAQK